MKNKYIEPLIYKYECENKDGYQVISDILNKYEIPESIKGSEISLKSYPERELLKHYINYSNENYSIDNGFYPLGSCTMKYNPKISEKIVSSEKLRNIHPDSGDEDIQGTYSLLYLLQNLLLKITGMDTCTLQPAAGAQGELAGMIAMRNYFNESGMTQKKIILVPDSAHGTNPASAVMAGFEILKINSDSDGFVDVESIKQNLSDKTAGIMLTNPNTLGLFEKNIFKIAEYIHSVNGLLYYDGANLNANLGYSNPGIMGFDVAHINLHKTFAAPHGAGGPGSGVTLAKNKLKNFLPGYYIEKNSSGYLKISNSDQLHAYNGNVDVLIKSLIYILVNGSDGLKKVSEHAVLNANYLKEKLKKYFQVEHDCICKHEFVLNDSLQHNSGITTLNIAKRLIDYGYHPPTIYFPLIVKGAIMIEPTETETKQSLDNFINTMISISRECSDSPDTVTSAPVTTPVSRPDETLAARNPILVEE